MKNIPFMAKIRKQNESYIVTIPSIVAKMGTLKAGDYIQFFMSQEESAPQIPTPVQNCQTSETKTILNANLNMLGTRKIEPICFDKQTTKSKNGDELSYWIDLDEQQGWIRFEFFDKYISVRVRGKDSPVATYHVKPKNTTAMIPWQLVKREKTN